MTTAYRISTVQWVYILTGLFATIVLCLAILFRFQADTDAIVLFLVALGVGLSSLIIRRIRTIERALTDSEERFRSIFENVSDVIFTLESDGTLSTASPSCERILGWSPKELIGRHFSLFVHPDDLPQMQELSIKAPERESLPVFLVRVLRKAGAHLEAEISARQVHRDDSIVTLGVLRDIGGRQQAEAALRESWIFIHSLLEHMPARIFWKDCDSRYLGCNTLFAKDAGYSRPVEVIGKTDFEMGWKELAELYRADDKASMESGQPKLDYEEPATTPEGHKIWVRTSKVPLKDESKQIIGILGLYQDITEQKRAQEQRELYFKFFTLSSEPMCIADPFGCFRLVNPAFVRLTGYSDVELVSQPFLNFVLAEDRQKTSNEMELQVKARPSLNFENRYQCKDGSVIQLSWTAYFDKKDGVTYATARDITAHKQAAMALERSRRALSTLSACNEALVHDGDETELLASICRLIVDLGGYRMAWVGFSEQDTAKTVRPVAHYGLEEAYLETEKISWGDNGFGRVPAATAIRTGTVQVGRNFLIKPLPAPWKEAAQQRGYLSSVALPLGTSTYTLGALTIYSSEVDAFDEAEVELLRRLAEDLAFGIEMLRMRIEHERISEENLRHSEAIRKSLEESVKAIAGTVEMRDPYTAGHERRVGQLSVAIARDLGLSEDRIRGVELAAIVHDLGKISVPAEILSKPARLTAIESMLLKNHAQAGHDILKDIKFPWPIATIVWQHHERIDGSGYPQGLKGCDILLESRILAVADVVEAMASHRPYRPAKGIVSALQELKRGRGRAYDAAVVDTCIRLFEEKQFAFFA